MPRPQNPDILKLHGRPAVFGLDQIIRDNNKTVALVERIGRLSLARLSLNSTYANSNTGHITNTSLPVSMEIAPAREKQLEICEMYEPTTSPAYTSFPDTTSEIPKDSRFSFHILSRSFRRRPDSLSLGKVSSFVPVSQRKQDLYDAMARSLGGDVFLTVMGVRIIRTDEGVEASVQNADRLNRHPRERLLIAFEPTLRNLGAIDLDEKEAANFSKWEWSHVHVEVISQPYLLRWHYLANRDPNN
ncbi:hypothetical protein BDP55DRAFT_720591 [Colletotrichum godetiae]|uniref:Uncharacterized protein n=1 Tax=Colletotrichum godetiae TaxID=1209918 RepID=A0AAJ0A9V4_9PEZI|nr:uncharacterized protein BDP55DRAFT_720591 [Colletotrichum godetiae]KAK1658538.1 hypothetical protein BDP55DRAFT_720591 [Colletotrichum godetiae]